MNLTFAVDEMKLLNDYFFCLSKGKMFQNTVLMRIWSNLSIFFEALLVFQH